MSSPIREIAVQMPGWVTMLESGHWLQSAVYTAMLDFAASLRKMADIAGKRPQLGSSISPAPPSPVWILPPAASHSVSL